MAAAARPAGRQVPELGEVAQPLLEVEGGWHGPHPHAEPDHGHRDVGLDPDDHGHRAAQPRHLGQRAQRARGEAVDHVQRRDVDDHSTGAVLADLAHEVLLEAHHLRVVQGSVDRCDEGVPLSQDRDERRSGVHEPSVTSVRVTR